MSKQSVSRQPLSLAVNGREYQLEHRLVEFTAPAAPTRRETIAIVGLGYVGLPTAYALSSPDRDVIGIDISQRRLDEIADGTIDLPEQDRRSLATAVESGQLRLTADLAALSEVDTVIICVPTPVTENYSPDLAALRAASDGVVHHARPGQTIILTSTTFAGTTRELLAEPLQQRGLSVGREVYVAFSPERIDPGNLDHHQSETPRIVGGMTSECATHAARVIGHLTTSVYLVGSPEAAELTKLYENIFRAVNLALANEFADACGELGLDPIEITIAAGTKPYGFLGSFPGPGVGGHCIPCDPHYLLWQLRQRGRNAPLLEEAMRLITARPNRVVHRALDVLDSAGIKPANANVLLVGVSYKAGVRDLRESPALPIISGLRAAGAAVSYHDPLVPEVELDDGDTLRGLADPHDRHWDLVVVHTVHPGLDYEWVRDCPRVLDATYQFDTAAHREVV